MSSQDINLKSLDELQEMQSEIKSRIKRKETELLDAARKEIESAAMVISERTGLHVDLIMNRNSQPVKRSPVAAKYKNPSDPSETWTGRGRKPKWVEDHIAAGGNTDDLLIVPRGGSIHGDSGELKGSGSGDDPSVAA